MLGKARLTTARFGAMQIDTQSLRRNLRSLDGLNEWSRNDRDLLIKTLLEILDGLEDLSNDIDDLS